MSEGSKVPGVNVDDKTGVRLLEDMDGNTFHRLEYVVVREKCEDGSSGCGEDFITSLHDISPSHSH